MVGYDPQQKVELTNTGYALAGAGSGFLTRCIAQPLDVLKIRFQLQCEPITRSPLSKYHSMPQAVLSICREEGVQGFWKGHVPAQGLSLVYGVVQFTIFEMTTRQIWNLLPAYFSKELKPFTHFVCGNIAGCAAMVVAQPFDVIRTRFVAQNTPKIYHSMVQAGRLMVRTEGVVSLYKGMVPAMLQIAPQTGFQFGYYSFFTIIWDTVFSHSNQQGFDTTRSLACGALAGLCAKASVYPLDLVKKRLQVQGFGENRSNYGKTIKYTGLVHCFRLIYHKEGLRGLYKGLSPSMIKSMVTVACHMWTYEMLCQTLAPGYSRR